MKTEYKIDRTRPDTNVFVLNLFLVLSVFSLSSVAKKLFLKNKDL